MNPKEVLNQIVELFKSGDLPETVAYSFLPALDIPSMKWSFLNRLIMTIHGTQDARGYRQWLKAKRFVKKGAKAIYILAPCIRKVKEENEEKLILSGFKAVPVFRVQDTDGEELDYQIRLMKFPLAEKAKEWGLNITAIPVNPDYYGYFSGKEIALATEEEKVFFHELVHAGHSRLKKLKPGQDPFQEITAELGAQALCRLIGKQPKDTTGNSYKYIERYAQETKLSPVSACLAVLNEVEQVLNLILKGGDYGEEAETSPQEGGDRH